MMPKRFDLTISTLPQCCDPQPNGCYNWNKSTRGKGYGQVHNPRTGGQDYAHRVVWELFHGEIPKGAVVRHKCDNPKCINIDHLELGTYSDNNLDTWTRHPDKEKRREARRDHMINDPFGDYQRGREIGSPIGLAIMNEEYVCPPQPAQATVL